MSNAISMLPSSFVGQWMAPIHWYIVSIGLELELNPAILQNYSHFVDAAEFVMTIKARSVNDIIKLH